VCERVKVCVGLALRDLEDRAYCDGDLGLAALEFIVEKTAREQRDRPRRYVDFPREKTVSGVAGASLRARLGVVGLRGCGLPLVGRIVLPLCVGVEAGGSEGEGLNLEEGQRQRRPWLAFVIAPSLRWSLDPRVGLWIGAEVAIPLVAPSFVVEVQAAEDIVVHRPAAFTGRALVGLAFVLRRGSKKL